MIDDLATMADPAPQLAELRRRGVHQTADGRWVVTAADDVHRALTDAALLVPPRSGDGPLDRLRAAMARFSDGPDHEHRRQAVDAVIARLPVAALVARATAVTRAHLAAGGPIDAADLTRAVLTSVLVEALDLTAAVDEVARLSALLAPVAGSPRPTDDGVVALAARVVAEPMDAARVAAFSIVHQARDATAGLVAAALARDGDVDAAALVDAPVQLTVRRARDGARLGGVDLPAGAPVVVLLAAVSAEPRCADLFPDTPPTFGAGPHACPGVALARALALAIIGAVRGAGALVTSTGAYEARANLRVPTVTVRSS